MEILRVENLCKSYGKASTLVRALDDVSFLVNDRNETKLTIIINIGKIFLLILYFKNDRAIAVKIISYINR